MTKLKGISYPLCIIEGCKEETTPNSIYCKKHYEAV